MALIEITGPTRRDGGAGYDKRPWKIRAASYQAGGDGGVITPGEKARTVYPVGGVLTFKVEAGISFYLENPDSDDYLVTAPAVDASLWDVIEAGIAFPPDTSQEQLAAAVDGYVLNHADELAIDDIQRSGDTLLVKRAGETLGAPIDISDFLLGVDDVLQETVENIVGNYETETLALLDRITVRPDFDHRDAINSLIKALKDAGIWAKLDGLYLLAAHTQQAALLNWKANARNLTAYNSPVFTADRGIAGDGVSAFLQVPQFAGSTLSMTAGDESLGIWTRVNNANDNVYSLTIGTGSSGTGTNRFINPRTVSTGTTWKINTASQSSPAIAGGNDMFVSLSRNSTDAYEYINGAQEDSYTGALVDDPQALSLYVTIGRQSTTYSIRQHSAMFYGRYLSAAEQAVFYNALNDYMTALGAN